MIVRRDGSDLLFITQPDHAVLAQTIMAAWRTEGFPASPRRALILLATRHHDDGWLPLDRAPIFDAQSGSVLNFMTAPDEARQSVWPRGVERLASQPYAAALVAQHALAIYEPNRVHPEWAPFFDRMQALRDSWLARAAPLTLDDLLSDYFFVRMGDLLSLTFCCRWREPREFGGYEARCDGDRLLVTPDPFGGRSVDLLVRARRIDAETLTDEAAATARFRAAPVGLVAGVARGRSPAA